MKYKMRISSPQVSESGFSSLRQSIISLRFWLMAIPLFGSILILPACGNSESVVTPVVNTTVNTDIKDIASVNPSIQGGPLITPSLPPPNGREQLTQVYDPAGATTAPQTITISTHNCGLAPAASGASYMVLAFYATKCENIMAVAQQFGPHAGDGKQHLYQNWICGPSSVPGYSGLCTSRGESFGLKNP